MSKITPCLWFNGEAEEAANFYVSLLPDSKIEIVQRNTIDGPGGTALVVEFTLAG
jgi:predicted 3-demethylubiquinone-9 3-methyltransferase (glyoxalase superfamily)